MKLREDKCNGKWHVYCLICRPMCHFALANVLRIGVRFSDMDNKLNYNKVRTSKLFFYGGGGCGHNKEKY